MLTARFQDLLDQRLGQSPVKLLTHLDPPSGRMAGDVLCTTSTFEGSILPWRGLLLIVPNVYFQLFRNRIIEKGFSRPIDEKGGRTNFI
jgi:hypothetical protein